jgi:hypothetical protein
MLCEATAAVALQYPRGATVPRVLFTAATARAARALGEAGRGASPTAGKRRFFLLISCFIRLIHLLSLYREVYLTPKQATN